MISRKSGVRVAGAQGGFSLVEMLTVLLVLSILTAIAMPVLSRWVAHSATNDAAISIVAHLKQARNLAVSENRSVRVVFTATTYTYDKDMTGTCSPCKNLTMLLTQYSSGLSVTTNVATNTFTFASLGTATTGTVTITDALDTTYTKNITVNMIGRSYYSP